MCSGHVCCILAPDHVALPSELQISWVKWMIARNDPFAATTTLQCLSQIWAENKKTENHNNVVTPNCSTTNPKSQIATPLAPKNELRRQNNFWQKLFCQSRVDCCKFRFDPLGENKKLRENCETQQQPTNSPKLCTINIDQDTSFPRHTTTRVVPDLLHRPNCWQLTYQNELQNRNGHHQNAPRNVYLCSGRVVAVWPQTASHYPSKNQLYGPLGW